MTDTAPATPVAPAADEKSVAPAPVSLVPTDANYLTVWLDKSDNLKFEAKGMSIYMIVAALRAATIRFEDVLAGKAPAISTTPGA